MTVLHRPKVLFVTRKFPPSVGGMQRYCADLVGSLAGKVDVQLISHGGSQVLLPLFATRAAWGIRRSDAPIVHFGDVLAAALLWPSARRRGMKLVATAHGLDVIWRGPFYRRLAGKALAAMDAVVCVSEATRRRCLERGARAESTVVIPNGIDAGKFRAKASATSEQTSTSPTIRPSRKEESRRRAGKLVGMDLASAKLILYIGRIVRRKGLDYFAREVLPRIVKAEPRAVFVTVGDGPAARRVKRMLDGFGRRAVMVGGVSDDDIDALYCAADVVVMPNVPVPGDIEGFGIVAIEAGARGVPVVASAVDGLPEALGDGRAGRLIPPGDARAFAEAVLEILEHDDVRTGLGEAARRFVLDRFDWRALADEYVELYKCLGGAPV